MCAGGYSIVTAPSARAGRRHARPSGYQTGDEDARPGKASARAPRWHICPGRMATYTRRGLFDLNVTISQYNKGGGGFMQYKKHGTTGWGRTIQ